MPSYTFSTVSVPGSSTTSANGLDNVGQIVGSYVDSAGHTHGFLDTSGTYTTIDVSGAISTSANGINNLGEIVGSFVDANGVEHGFLDNYGTITDIDAPGATTSTGTSANGINDLGQIVGSYWGPTNGPPLSDGTPDGSAYHAFVDNGGTFTDIGTPEYYGGEGITFFYATGINNSGQITGKTDTAPAGNTSGWVDTNNTITPTPPFPSLIYRDFPANGINNENQFVGSFGGIGNVLGLGYVVTNGVVATIVAPGASATLANGINDAGQIVGTSSQSAFLATPLPLAPTAVTLTGGSTVLTVPGLIDVVSGSNYLDARAGSTTVQGGAGTLTMYGGTGGDVVSAGGLTQLEFVGGAAPSTVSGPASGADTIFATGAVSYQGAGGSSLFIGGTGISTVLTAAHETLFGGVIGQVVELQGASSTLAISNGGATTVEGGSVAPVVWGNSNAQTLITGTAAGGDIVGYGDNDSINAGAAGGGAGVILYTGQNATGGSFTGNTVITLSAAGNDTVGLFAGGTAQARNIVLDGWKASDTFFVGAYSAQDQAAITKSLSAAIPGFGGTASFTLSDQTTVTFLHGAPNSAFFG